MGDPRPEAVWTAFFGQISYKLSADSDYSQMGPSLRTISDAQIAGPDYSQSGIPPELPRPKPRGANCRDGVSEYAAAM